MNFLGNTGFVLHMQAINISRLGQCGLHGICSVLQCNAVVVMYCNTILIELVLNRSK